jgi:ketopantoate reductase
MRIDIDQNRPLEIDAIFGAVAIRAKENGVEVPTLDVIYTLLKGINSRIEQHNAANRT